MGKWVCLLLMLSLLGGSRGCVAAVSDNNYQVISVNRNEQAASSGEKTLEEIIVNAMKDSPNNPFLKGLLGGVTFLLLINTVVSIVWKLSLMVKTHAFGDVPKKKEKGLLYDFLSRLYWGELVLLASCYKLRYEVDCLNKTQRNNIFTGSNGIGFFYPLLFLYKPKKKLVGYVFSFFSGYLQAYHFFFALFSIPYLFKWLKKRPIRGVAAVADIASQFHFSEGIKVLLGAAFFLVTKWKNVGAFKVMMYVFGFSAHLVFVLWAANLLKWGYNVILEMGRIMGKYGHEEGVAQADSAGENSVATPSLTETNKASDNRPLVVFEKKGKGRKGVVLWAGLLALFILFGLGSFYFISKGRNH